MANQITTLRMGQEKKKTPVGDLPMDWGLAALGEIAEINPEVLPEDTPLNAAFRYIDISSIERPGVISSTREVTFGTAPSRARRIVKCGDILVSTVRPYLRAFALVTSKETNLLASTGFAVIRPKSGMNGEYLWQYVLGNAFVKFLESRMTGSNYPAVNPSDVAEALVPVPPLYEQEMIVKSLSAIDESVEAARKEVEMSHLLRRHLAHSLIRRNIKKWDSMPLHKVLAEPIRNGYSPVCPSETTGRWTLELGALSPEGFRADRIKPAPIDDPKCNESLLKRGDLLVSRSNTINLVGLASIYDGNPDNCIYPDLMMRVRPSPAKIVPAFLQNYLVSPMGRRYFQTRARGTSGSMVKINASILGGMPIPVPSLAEQARIVDGLSDVRALANANENIWRKLRDLKQGLMRGLLTGKMRVVK